MKTQQQKVWNAIAPEWSKFKKTNDKEVIAFLKKSKGNILDLGCGSGRYFTKTKATIYALDFSDEMLKLAKKKARELKIKAELVQHDLTKKLPFKDNFFDNIICIGTLHCIKGEKNRQKILKEIYRVLKPNARVLIKVWNRKSKRFGGKEEKIIKWRDKGARYYYFYIEEELLNELKKAGFEVISPNSKNKEFAKQEIVVIIKKTMRHHTLKSVV
mgnify:CR=1 FL=1